MKTLTVNEAEKQLGQLIAEAHRGDVIVLTDGEKEVTLEPRGTLDLEQDSPELEAELLKAANGPFTPYSRKDLEAVAERVLREKRQT